MKKVCLALVLAGGALLSANALALLPGKAPTSAPGKLTQREDSITIFWEKFKAAVIKGDKETVAALSQFPISRGYGMASLKKRHNS